MSSSTKADTPTNRKPADHLVDVCERIAVLREEEEVLRQGFISGALPLDGDDYTVLIETKTNERVDSRAMRRHVDERIWRPYLIATPTVYVRTERKTIAPELKTRSRAPT